MLPAESRVNLNLIVKISEFAVNSRYFRIKILSIIESVAKVKTILQLDNRSNDFIYNYKFFA
jgi:hypothetical protein